MKLSFALLTIALAQRNKPNKWAPTPTPTTTTTTKYTKPKPTKYTKPKTTTTPYPTTTDPTTTSSEPYPTTTKGKYANQYGSYVYDDPHFSVQAPGQLNNFLKLSL